MAEMSERWTATQVAVCLGCTWRRAYDLILTGKFGEAELRGKRTWTADPCRVRAYLAHLELKRAARHA